MAGRTWHATRLHMLHTVVPMADARADLRRTVGVIAHGNPPGPHFVD